MALFPLAFNPLAACPFKWVEEGWNGGCIGGRDQRLGAGMTTFGLMSIAVSRLRTCLDPHFNMVEMKRLM